MRRLASPLGMVLVGFAAIGTLTLVWLRGTAASIAGKPALSDRALKTEVRPVRW